jgi:hypothetical protein
MKPSAQPYERRQCDEADQERSVSCSYFLVELETIPSIQLLEPSFKARDGNFDDLNPRSAAEEGLGGASA